MKKAVIYLAILLGLNGISFAATSQDALNFFNKYVSAANSYNPIITTMYSPDAKIIRQVLKPDGTIVARQTDTARYVSEMKKGQAVARLRNYKNYYSNIQVSSLGNDTFKVT